MKKWLIRSVIGVLVLLIVAVILVVVYVDNIAKTAIEKGATYALGVNTTLENVSIGLVSGEFTMANLNVANPEGFSAGDHFLSLGSGELAVSLASLTKDQIDVPKLHLSGIDLVLEKKGDSANYQVIINNLKKLESKEKSEPAPSEGEGKKVVVHEIVIRDVNVTAYVVQIGGATARPVHVTIPEIRAVFGTEEGMTVHELTNLIVQTVMAAVIKNAGHLLPGVIVDGLAGGMGQLAALRDTGAQVASEAAKIVGDVGGEAAKALGEAGKTLEGVSKDSGKAIEGAGKALEGATKDLGKGLNDLGKGVGGLFGKDKEKDKK